MDAGWESYKPDHAGVVLATVLGMTPLGLAGQHWTLPPSPLPAPITGGRIYHYTSADGLRGLIQGGALWASRADMLNDASEVEHGVRLINERWKTKRFEVETPLQQRVHEMLEWCESDLRRTGAYVVCASTEGDDLGQWRAYGGYAVELDPDGDLSLADHEPDRDEAESLALDPVGWRNVLYEEQDQHELVGRLIDAIVKSVADTGYDPGVPTSDQLAPPVCASWYHGAVSLMKDIGFEGEHEVRLVIRKPLHYAHLNFRTSRIAVVPYVEVRSAEPDDDRLPIKGVNIGPTPHGVAAAEGVRALLLHAKYDNRVYHNVHVSAVPYRY